MAGLLWGHVTASVCLPSAADVFGVKETKLPHNDDKLTRIALIVLPTNTDQHQVAHIQLYLYIIDAQVPIVAVYSWPFQARVFHYSPAEIYKQIECVISVTVDTDWSTRHHNVFGAMRTIIGLCHSAGGHTIPKHCLCCCRHPPLFRISAIPWDLDSP